MCGIAGIITRDGSPPPRHALQRLADALIHRGPDGSALYVRGGVGLVHTRLAIIDLMTGQQPLVADDGTALVANAEIYNDLELRRALTATFKTNSDCESALHLYRRDGETFARTLRGMYAVAVHDPAKNRVLLARDPFGIKPLYIAETPAGLCFASEPQALIAAGLVAPRIDPAARDELLALQFTTRCPFDGIARVAPGETLVIAHGRITDRIMLDPLAASAGSQAFDAAWADSIQVHRRADVPYGMFLSGGIDSAAVLAMMARQERRPVVAYTAAFPKTAAPDEREQARRVAEYFGASHVELNVTAFDFWKRLPQIAAAMDDPVADYAVIPSYLLAERAKADVKVILTGEGGDELFAGYGRYRSALRPWPFRKTPWSKSALSGLGVLRAAPPWRAGLEAIERTIPAAFDPLQKVQALDIRSWLPDDLLLKVDRCLMVHGIEGRVPFLDPAVTAAAFALPRERKIRQGLGKWALREWLAAAMPGYPAFDRKRGFSVPVGEWIAAQSRHLAPLVAAQPGIAEVCVPERVRDLFSHGGVKHGQAQWLLLFYALWHNRHILGRSVDSDVFGVLDSK